jgi:hypothetical protein
MKIFRLSLWMANITIIPVLDRDIEQLEPQVSDQGTTNSIQELLSDRDKLIAEVQFYRDQREDLENRIAKIAREEL